MTQQSDDQTVAPEDINLFGESDWIGQNDEPADDPDPGTTPDAEAMVVSLKKTTHNKVEVHEIETMMHGFVVRGDLKDPAIFKAYEDTLANTKKFLAKFL